MIQQVASLLWLGFEDYTGLWEAVAEVRSYHPEMTSVEVQREAAKVIRELANAGMIEIYICHEPVEDETASRLTRRQYEVLLSDVNRWNPLPVSESDIEIESVRYATTDSGLAAYRRLVERNDV